MEKNLEEYKKALEAEVMKPGTSTVEKECFKKMKEKDFQYCYKMKFSPREAIVAIS